MNIEDYLSDKENRPIALASMCLDPIHHGHINIIKEAKKYGNVVIGLMTDEAMLSYKRKPRIPFEDRLIVSEELKLVSYIFPLDGINYDEIAEKYKFEYFLHGDDWKSNIQSDSRNKLIEVMKNWGGVVIDVPYTKGISSSQIVKNFKS